MKSDCYIVSERYWNCIQSIVGVVATNEEAEVLKILSAKEQIKNDFFLSQKFNGATEEDYKKFADDHYIITKEAFYSKPFRTEELQ